MRDETMSLITRLRQNVIKTGLRKINASYSRWGGKAHRGRRMMFKFLTDKFDWVVVGLCSSVSGFLWMISAHGLDWNQGSERKAL
mmetsp:Transcript_20626/g.83730  ORF Transcript_20626/g.83730 Transcript_20626/m.83730 type:complete len:85 (-) Transcript_20626:1505-1759(-)